MVPGLALLMALAGAPTAVAGPIREAADPTAGVQPRVTADATTTMLEGIDVSHWQDAIDWTKVAAAGKSFAIIKATDGQKDSFGKLYSDPNYPTNHAAAKAAGLWTGAYHFARPDATVNDAIDEADYFAAAINLGVGDLIPALDLEVSGGLAVPALQAWVATFLGEVTTRIGARPMIYTSPAFWKKYMGDSRALADAGYTTLWIAHWNVTSPTVAASNWGGHGWTFWQYSNCGHVNGISGCVDLDRYSGLDLAAQAYSVFRLAASIPAGPVKQGMSSAARVAIVRTNFSSEIALDVTGLPDGSIATFDTNPTTDSTVAMTVQTPADPSATPLGTYPLTITGVAAGLTRTATVNLVVADGIPPTVVAPFTGLSGNKTLGSTTVPVRVRWSASDPSGVATEGLQRSVNGVTWTGVALPTTTATSVDQNLTFGSSVRQRARATDRLANTSPWVAGSLVKASLTQQTALAVTWRGRWHTVRSASASGGSLRYATSAGASATFRFTGSSIAWVSARGTTRGSARVSIDGVYATTVNLRSSIGRSRAIVFARNWLTSGTHTITVVVVGTAGHPRVDIDAFVRLSIS